MDDCDDIFSRSMFDRNRIQRSRRRDLVYRSLRATKARRHDSRRLPRAACCTVFMR